MRKISVFFVLSYLVLHSTLCAIADNQAGDEGKEEFRAYNEWGKLHTVIVGIDKDMIIPEYIPQLKWMTGWAKDDCEKYGGRNAYEVVPEEMDKLRTQLENFVKVLKQNGVKVYRNIPFRYPEERAYLDEIQKGSYLLGGADFIRVIDDKVILLTNFQDTFRRKQVFSVRPVIEKLLKEEGIQYVAMPPCSPHLSEDDMYLENGDIMVDGKNVYVGMSGNASNKRGTAWLQQFLGPEYKVYTIELDPNAFHLDTVLSLNKKGLLTYYPDIVKELPEPLKNWDKIKVYKEEGEEEAFGANNLSLDEETIIVAEQYKRLKGEYEKRGMKVILVPLDMTIEYGSGPRCLTGIIKRDM